MSGAYPRPSHPFLPNVGLGEGASPLRVGYAPIGTPRPPPLFSEGRMSRREPAGRLEMPRPSAIM